MVWLKTGPVLGLYGPSENSQALDLLALADSSSLPLVDQQPTGLDGSVLEMGLVLRLHILVVLGVGKF